MKKENLDYLIVAPMATEGQKGYYQERKKMLEELGYTCKILIVSKNSLLNFLNLPWPYGLYILALKYKIALWFFLKSHKPKIIEFQNNTLLFQSKRLLQKYTSFVSFDYPNRFKMPWYGFFIQSIEEKKFRLCSKIISRSHWAYFQLKNEFNSIIFSPHSINSQANILKFGESKKVLYYCSPKLPFEKGLDIAIKFWEIYLQKNKRLRLEIAGISKEDSLEYLRKKKIELPPRVDFLGKLTKENYFEEVKSCFFMINTSRIDESPRSILECLSNGRVIFATPTTGAKEILKRLDKKLISKNFEPSGLIKLIKNSEEEYNIELKEYFYDSNKRKLLKLIKKLLTKK